MTRSQWIGGATLVVVAIGIGLGIYWLCTGIVAPEVRLPVLAISGVIALLLALAIVAGAFTLFNLANAREALGLPEGSVRAVIALSLIVLFAILSVYLYTDLSRGGLHTVPNLDASQKDELLKSIPPVQVLASIADAATPQHFTVLYRDGNAAGQDVAKQILVMIGTLMTAVASFYFGAKTSTAPVDPAPRPKPTLRSIAPDTAALGTFDLEINGDSLDLIKEVKIALGARQIIASGVVSSTSVIKCELTVPASETTGKWTVIATDGAGQSVQLANALTLK
jgi:hypothetical protein